MARRVRSLRADPQGRVFAASIRQTHIGPIDDLECESARLSLDVHTHAHQRILIVIEQLWQMHVVSVREMRVIGVGLQRVSVRQRTLIGSPRDEILDCRLDMPAVLLELNTIA